MSKRELNELRDLIEQLFVDSVAGKLTVKTYYHTKKGVSQSAMTLLAQTSETYGATLSVANIPILWESK